MSMNIGDEIKKTAGAITVKAKNLPEKPTTEGIATNFVGYIASIPVSYFYDWVWDLVANKVITNDMARDLIKIALPCAIGGVFHLGKLPFGNIVAGLGYGIGAISAVKLLITKIKGYSNNDEAKETLEQPFKAFENWGVQ